jgi:ankyrin repeat/BTB/POZ domain-containing protein 1
MDLRQGNIFSQVHPSAFKSLMQYIYTARLEIDIDAVDDCVCLAVQCRLPLLKEELEDMVKKVNSFGKVNLICKQIIIVID